MLRLYGNIRSVAFYGFMNTPYHYEWNLLEGATVEENSKNLLAEKNKRIKPLIPTIKCAQLDELAAGE